MYLCPSFRLHIFSNRNMNFTVLIDNRRKNEALWSEHGFSLLFETDGQLILLDTGASGRFADNWEMLAENRNASGGNLSPGRMKKASRGVCLRGTRPADTGCLILSHGHNDHTGGLRTFLECNFSAPVYISARVKGAHYYSCRTKTASDTDTAPDTAPETPLNDPGYLPVFREYRSIGVSQAVLEEYQDRIIYIRGSRRLTPKVSLIDIRAERLHIPPRWPLPAGNATLLAEDHADTFDHELAVAVEDPDGLVVLSPCSHTGVLNILEACQKFTGNRLPVKAFIGGTHLVEYVPDTIEQTRELALTIKEKYPQMKFFSGHCTCQAACGIFEDILGERYETFYSGYCGKV